MDLGLRAFIFLGCLRGIAPMRSNFAFVQAPSKTKAVKNWGSAVRNSVSGPLFVAAERGQAIFTVLSYRPVVQSLRKGEYVQLHRDSGCCSVNVRGSGRLKFLRNLAPGDGTTETSVDSCFLNPFPDPLTGLIVSRNQPSNLTVHHSLMKSDAGPIPSFGCCNGTVSLICGQFKAG